MTSATIRHLVNCPYTEPGKGYLRNQMNKRKGITTKNYICEDCGYAAKNILRDHRITVHKIGEKQHKCDQCPWTFYLKASLTDHINEVHKKIKNHKCEECGYAANAGNWKVHINAVHKKIRNVYSVLVCGHYFF